MNYQYSLNEEGSGKQQQQTPMFFAIPQPQPSQPQEQIALNQEQSDILINGRLRNVHAQCRSMEEKILLDGMHEIRAAIQMAEIAGGDTGTSERPPLTPAFDDVNRGRLQACYLTLAERLVNYCDHVLTQELKIRITNEIKK